MCGCGPSSASTRSQRGDRRLPDLPPSGGMPSGWRPDPGLARIDKEVNQRLRALARQPRSKRRTPQPGTRLLREWGGELHEVTVTDRGYAYRGIVYTSLTAVAIRITGTRWSGPRFFGAS